MIVEQALELLAGILGALNRSSQQPADGGCDDDRQTKIRTIDEAQTALTGPAMRGATVGAAPLLVPDCLGFVQRGRCRRDRDFAAGRNTVVSRGWRHAPFTSGPIRAGTIPALPMPGKSAKRSLCSWRRTSACVRLHGAWAARPRPSRGRSVAMPPRALAGSIIVPQRPSGMPNARPGGRRPRSWRRTRRCGSMCRTGSRAISRTRAARSLSARRQPGKAGDTGGGSRVSGPPASPPAADAQARPAR